MCYEDMNLLQIKTLEMKYVPQKAQKYIETPIYSLNQDIIWKKYIQY